MKQRLIQLIGLALLLVSPVLSQAQICYQYWIDDNKSAAVNGTTTDGTAINLSLDVAGLSPGAEVVCLTGTGSVKATSLTVTDSIDASVALTGDLTLADGVTVLARSAPTTVSGTLTIAGGGTVTLPAFDAPLATWTLFTASSISGAANLASWSFTNLPRNKKATLQVQGDAVVATVADAGLMLIFR